MRRRTTLAVLATGAALVTGVLAVPPSADAAGPLRHRPPSDEQPPPGRHTPGTSARRATAPPSTSRLPGAERVALLRFSARNKTTVPRHT